MGLFDKFRKQNEELEALLSVVENNAANNYKDAAQKGYKAFLERYQQLLDADMLSDKQKVYYRDKRDLLDKELQGFHH